MCDIPHVVQSYIQHLTYFLTSHKVLQSLHHLYTTHDGNFTPEQAEQLQGLDMLCSQGMLLVEKKYRKFAMGKVDYSPIVAETRLHW
jgi:hypothetical protein